MKHLELESPNAIFVLSPTSETESVWTVMSRLRAQLAAHATISGFCPIIFTCSYTGPPNTGALGHCFSVYIYQHHLSD